MSPSVPAKEELETKKEPPINDTAILVIDMQNDFLLPGSPTSVAGGLAVVPSVKQAVEGARKKKIPVIWVKREHHASGMDVELSRRHLFEGGRSGILVPGTAGAALVDGLVAEEQDIVVIKKRFSAFFGTSLDSILRNLGVENLLITGVQTPNCIRATAFDAVSLDYKHVGVLADATASATDEVQAANLADMRKAGIETPTLQGFLTNSLW
eukprot:jgi/Mesen1/420/ME000100S10656